MGDRRNLFQLIITMTTLTMDISHIMGLWRISHPVKLYSKAPQIFPISKKCPSILIVIVINQVSNSRDKAHASDFLSLSKLPPPYQYTVYLLLFFLPRFMTCQPECKIEQKCRYCMSDTLPILKQ